MRTGNDCVVLDASAILALLLLEKGADRVKVELRSCRERRQQGWVSAATIAEMARRLRRSLPSPDAHQAVDHLLLTPLSLAPVDLPVARLAGDFAHETGVSLVDCIVAATAALHSARVLTADPDFRKLAPRVPVTFIR